MSANEDNLNEAKRIQREEFNKRLLAAMALKNAAGNDVDEVDGKKDENILVKIVKKKYGFIETFDQSEAIQIQRKLFNATNFGGRDISTPPVRSRKMTRKKAA